MSSKGSFVCSPQIIVRISTAHDTFDVSDDITQASINRRLGVSSASVTLSNHRRKWDGTFSPMDKIVIYLRRVGPPLLVFSGYLDSVPAFSTFSGPVRLRASCTLKRLQHWMWDPHSQAGAEILMRGIDEDSGVTDGGIAQRTADILHEVGGWPKNAIHIAAVPDKWFGMVSEAGADLIADAKKARLATEAGSQASLGGQDHLKGLKSLPGVGEGTGKLPSEIGTVGKFGGSNGKSGKMSLTGEPIKLNDSQRQQHGGQYYVQGRWPYRTARGAVREGVDISKAEGWWKNRRILLVNPSTNKGVVVRAAHWGPHEGQGQDYNVSQAALDALGAKPGATIHVAFATETMSLGPVLGSASAGGVDIGAGLGSSGATTAPGETADDVAEMNKYGPIPPGHKIGSTFAQLEDFLQWLTRQGGYHVGEHPNYGGVTPGYHRSISEGGWHWWPPGNPPGGGAADISAGSGQEMERRLDIACREAALRGLGTIWRSEGHWTHLHVDISCWRRVGVSQMKYATIADVPMPTELGNPGNLVLDGSGGSTPGAGTGDPTAMGTALYNAFTWVSREGPSAISQILGGTRALMNDIPLYGTVDEMMKAGLRDWCSAPNGDIIGWFPDYFGHFGTAARMIIQPIEVLGDGFSVEWSDDRLKTHMFVTGSEANTGGILDSPPGALSASSMASMADTAGIATVEDAKLMEILFDVNPKDFADGGKGFLSRFGARPDFRPMNIISGEHAEFLFAVHMFMQNWSQQYSGRIQMSFMPEIYPGMIAAFPHWGVQAYVRGVTHTVDMEGGGGFQTQTELTAWSAIGDNAVIKGLPRGGTLE